MVNLLLSSQCLRNYDVLCQNVKKHNLENNVLAINAAVSHESKQSQYIINPKNMGDCRGHVFENELFEEETVNQTTLDDFFANNNTIGLEWNKIKFIKMDTQGSEISFLQGASNCFKEPFNEPYF